VLPTDTVYGVGCDAFLPLGGQRVAGRQGPGPGHAAPVLVGHARTLATAMAIGRPGRRAGLAETFWPGALTIVCRAQPSLD
jgi:tRNA A37 threonylcarbamoyladenosine synthetase subunit TsaC/SUA5/YrdC